MNSMYLMMYPLEDASIPCQLKLSFYNIFKTHRLVFILFFIIIRMSKNEIIDN